MHPPVLASTPEIGPGTLDRLYRPWRFDYVSAAASHEECVFCRIAAAPGEDDAKSYVVARGAHHFVVLNVYPYNTGHLMIVPYDHVSSLAELPAESLHEMADWARRAELALREAYHPEGFNLGMNVGCSAGAGIAGHLHLHVVPRWTADTNFMTVVGETRVLPESLESTWSRLSGRM